MNWTSHLNACPSTAPLHIGHGSFALASRANQTIRGSARLDPPFSFTPRHFCGNMGSWANDEKRVNAPCNFCFSMI